MAVHKGSTVKPPYAHAFTTAAWLGRSELAHPEYLPTEDPDGPWWWACQHPEKNDDLYWCRWSFTCWPCYVALFSVALSSPGATSTMLGEGIERPGTAAAMFREAHALRVEDDLRIIPPRWIEFALAARR